VMVDRDRDKDQGGWGSDDSGDFSKKSEVGWNAPTEREKPKQPDDDDD
jgi:hypothetical protein